ncbi:hypothetical protein [Brevundimonas sp. R86498]|uniref:hypothetical protein n=1 Tax=Brevundimonas sp. R86498 TaxID=3093845 RepID=UPI0037CC86FD
MRRLLVAGAALLALAGCDVFTAPGTPDSGVGREGARGGAFSHSQSEDLSGYYTVGETPVGPPEFRLTSLFVGQASAFEDWEAGRRTPGYAPVLLEFSGTGGGSERVVPDSYSVSDGRVRMTGTSADGQQIVFEGRMNAGALATARRNLGAAEVPAVTAVVRIGDRTWSGVKLNWTGGD